MNLRTPATEKRYREYLASGGKNDWATCYAIREFTYWKIIRNKFPYDAVATQHDLLIPKEPFIKFYDMPEEYITEFHGVTNLMELFYESQLKNSPHKRTVAEWWHLHLLNF